MRLLHHRLIAYPPVSTRHYPNFHHAAALTWARAGWQPAATGKMDAADFAGYWLRQQRIGTRGI
jgi:hypothetical protein